jgi:polyhydroxyalkanoate synthesis regulator phasin
MNFIGILVESKLTFGELNEGEIQELVRNGKITSGQAKELLTEIEKADKIWRLAKSDLKPRQFPD